MTSTSIGVVQEWRFRFVLGASLLLLACASEGEVSRKSLFNGTDLSGWKVPEPNPFWSVVDGVLTGQSDPKKKGSLLATEQSFGDVDFEAEVRFSGDIDSGVFFRNPELQVQIGISRMYRRDLTGSIYAEGDYQGYAKGMEELWIPGEWNRLRVIAEGPVFRVMVNGKEVLEFRSERYSGEAPIKLQIHPNVDMKVEFRKLSVGHLKDQEKTNPDSRRGRRS